jgi:hypothetical protein
LSGGPLALALAVACAVSACGLPDLTPPVSQPGALQEAFAVSNFFSPSGYMGDGEHAGFLRANVLDGGCKPRPPEAVGDCYRFVYHPDAKRWVGVYWVYPANNWGTRAGRRVEGTRFKEVRLRAASETPDLLVNFLVGGIKDPLLPNRDRVSAVQSVRLGPEWQTIRLDISGQQFDNVIGALAWSLPYPQDWDGDQPVVLYLDDLVWDTESSAPAAAP